MKKGTGEDDVYQVRKLNSYPVIYNRLDGALHPGKLMQALLDKVQKFGVTIQWNTGQLRL